MLQIQTKVYNEEERCNCMFEVEEKLQLLKESITIESDLYHYEVMFESLLNKLKNINPNNIKFLDFIIEKRVNDISLSRLNKYIYVYFQILDNIIISSIKKTDIQYIFLKIKNSKIADTTKRENWLICKMILKFFGSNIDFTNFNIKIKKKQIFKNDLLTKNERKIILKSNMNLEKKVFFSIMFDTGLRVGEVFSINRSSFKRIPEGFLVQIHKSKTKVRTVFVFTHIDLIKKLLNTKWDSWSFGYPMTRKVLQRFTKKFGKKIYNHLARHTKATEMYNANIKPLTLIKYFGWTNTKMLFDVYAHVDETDTLKEIIEYEKKLLPLKFIEPIDL